MEGAAEFHQRRLVAGVGGPAREVLVQGLEHLAGFFHEDLDDLVVDQVVVVPGVRFRFEGRFVGGVTRGVVDGLFGLLVGGVPGVVVRRLGDLRFVIGLRQGVAQIADAGPGQVENIVPGFRVVAEPLQVIFHRSDGVGQGVHAAPVRVRFAGHQAFFHEAHALAQDVRRAGQLHHFQAAAHGVEPFRHRPQVGPVPLRGDELDDAVLRFLQAGAAFAQHRVHGLAHVAGQGIAGERRRAAVVAADTGQSGFHVEQRAGHIHQGVALGRAAPADDVLHYLELFFHQGPGLAQAEHGDGVGDLLEADGLRLQAGRVGVAFVDEALQGVLHLGDLLGQGAHHRPHGHRVRAGHALAFGIDQIVRGQCLVQAEAGAHLADARAVVLRLGDVIKQVLEELRRRRPFQAVGTLGGQFPQGAVHLAEDLFHRGAKADHFFLQPFGEAVGDAPQRCPGGLAGNLLQLGEHLAHVAQVAFGVVVAHQAHQGELKHLADFARQLAEARVVAHRVRHPAPAFGLAHVRLEQGGFGEQRFAAGGAQVVEQGQQHHRQVAPVAGHPVQVGRQLQDGAHQGFLTVAHVTHAPVHQGAGQFLHFLGEQGGAVELHHLQGAVHLVQMGLAKAHARGVVGILHEGFQGLLGLVQGFLDLPSNPVQCQIVVTVAHDVSRVIIAGAGRPGYPRTAPFPDADPANR